MGGTVIQVGPLLAVVLVLLTVTASLVAHWGRLGVARAMVTAAARAVVQLGVVSLVIVAVLRSGWLTAGFVLLMYGIAAVTSARRTTAGRSGLLAALPIAAGAVPVLALILGTGLVPFRPIAVVPVAGILIGGAMTATSLAGRRALDELSARHDEYEARLALGFTNRQARRDVVRTTAAQALVPALDQTRTVGLVTLPGAFVGVLLGGAGPEQAGAAQVLVLIGLLAAETVAVVVVIGLVSVGLLSRQRN
ncbi:MAG TPA: ABC transporter permease [Micromonosporaceae bacterium]